MKKLNLQTLRVKSFVTSLSGEYEKTIKGGVFNQDTETIAPSDNNRCPSDQCTNYVCNTPINPCGIWTPSEGGVAGYDPNDET